MSVTTEDLITLTLLILVILLPLSDFLLDLLRKSQRIDHLGKIEKFLDDCLDEEGEKGLGDGLDKLIADEANLKKDLALTKKAFDLIKERLITFLGRQKISKECCRILTDRVDFKASRLFE